MGRAAPKTARLTAKSCVNLGNMPRLGFILGK
jgi:hypothetical protein